MNIANDVFPESITIGPTVYRVVFAKRVAKGKDLDGKIDYGRAVITIRRGLSSQVAMLVLWHEVIHGIFSNAGISGQDEQTIEILTSGIVAALRANPQLGR